MSGKYFTVDAGKCSGCQLCAIACKDEHVGNAYAPWTQPQPDTGHFWMNIKALERGVTPRVRVTYQPVMCQHCANAPCIKVCPEGAIKTRPDGLVWIDPAVCTGCGLCKEACPYDVIYTNEATGIAQKCTGCAHRVDEGLKPRCVDVCPHEAIEMHEHRPAGTEVYLPEHKTAPRVLWRGLPRPWIAGTVTDDGGEDVIAGVTVTVLDLADNTTVTTTSDAFGDFWVHGLVKGRKYQVTAAKAGHATFQAVVTADGDRDLGTIRLAKGR